MEEYQNEFRERVEHALANGYFSLGDVLTRRKANPTRFRHIRDDASIGAAVRNIAKLAGTER